MPSRRGRPNKLTVLKQKALLTAREECEAAGINPISLLLEALQVIRILALAPLRGAEKAKWTEALQNLSDDQRDRLIKQMKVAADVAYSVAEFVNPKLARMDGNIAVSGTIEVEDNSGLEFIRSRLLEASTSERAQGDQPGANGQAGA